MRKYIQFAAMTAIGVFVCSCVRETFQENFQPTDEQVSFVLESISTRSDCSEAVRNIKHRLGSDEQGNVFTLLETITNLDDIGTAAPETRGTPAYTENVLTALGSSFSGTVYNGTSQIAGDGTFDETYGMWRRDFGTDIWPESDPLTFFLRMPSEATGVSGLTYMNTSDEKSIAFDYETPEMADDQQDVIFAIRELNHDQYQSETSAKGGAAVLFRHALTGVKFAIGNNTSTAGARMVAGDVQTFITKVEFFGLKDKGHAVFTPDDSIEPSEQEVDITEEYSSAKSFYWTYEGSGSETYFYQTYDIDDILTFASGDGVGAPASFYAAGQQHNLNKEDASLTFWFIPQVMTSAVKVKVTFYVWNGVDSGDEMTLELDLGQRLLDQESGINAEWKPGQLRTFTLTPTTVDVDIDDEVENNEVKKNVVIRNTGNKDAYMRLVMVGNWVDADGNIVMGHVDTGTGEFTPYVAWDETQGTFTGLGGNGAWVKKSDGYWYYTAIVAPGDTPSVPVFETYTKPATVPTGAAGLVMDLCVQAVDASAGSDYEAAWAAVARPDNGDGDGGDEGDGE